MAIDKPSLAALLSQAKKVKPDAKESTRPFVLKDPKAIAKELLSKNKAPAPVDEDDEYLKSLLKDEEEAPLFEDEPEEQEDDSAVLKRIMQKLRGN